MQHSGDAVTDRSTLDAMVAFIKTNLVKTAQLDLGDAFLALSETAVRFNDTSWFWTDDNAKAAELLSDPVLYDADPATANAAMDFVLRMSEGAVIQRRCAKAELRVLSVDPAAFRVETAFFIIEGDLARGIVRHSLRFNDGRTVTAAQHTGNMISFRHARRSATFDVENTITRHEIRVEERSVVLSHTSTLQRAPTFLHRDPPVLAELTYSYSVSADRPSVGLTVTLAPMPGVTLRDVVLSTAIDQMSIVPGVDYRAVAIRSKGSNQTHRTIADKRVFLHSGPADYCSVVQEGASPGFSYAIHTLLRDGAKLDDILARGQLEGRLHWLINRYAMGTVSGDNPAIIREERMVTGGGYYDALEHYTAVLSNGLGGGSSDPSMTYDIGAELNAIATHILFARMDQYAKRPSETRLESLTTWYDRHVQRYFDFIRPGEAGDLDRIFTRGIAFTVLSLDCMLRATADERYRTYLNTAVQLILRMQRRRDYGRDTHDATFGDTWAGLTPFLDNHAACLLALARASRHGDPDGALGRAIQDGILGIRLYSGVVDLGGGHLEAYDGLAVLNPSEFGSHADTGFWNFKLGVVLRALYAAGHAAADGAIVANALDRQRREIRQDVACSMLASCMRKTGETLEILTSRIAGETNSETQPWVALGLAPVIDQRVVTLQKVTGPSVS